MAKSVHTSLSLVVCMCCAGAVVVAVATTKKRAWESLYMFFACLFSHFICAANEARRTLKKTLNLPQALLAIATAVFTASIATIVDCCWPFFFALQCFLVFCGNSANELNLIVNLCVFALVVVVVVFDSAV